MADRCRPEVDSEVISGQKVEDVQVNIVTKFHDLSSNHVRNIRSAHIPLRQNQLSWLGPRAQNKTFDWLILPRIDQQIDIAERTIHVCTVLACVT